MGYKGVVVRATGSWYDVLSEGVTYNCRIRGKLRLKGVRSTSPVVVGDVVSFELSGEQENEGLITDVDQRRNYIIRRASNLSKESHIIAANIDQAMIVATLASPPTATEFIDRFLITCEAYKIPAIIILAKIDLAEEMVDRVEEFKSIYQLAGYEVIEISALRGDGMEQLKERLRGVTTLISGNSGVGKS
ncbi:MAG: ribosome small subunit-dependent GTPase A, partial [Rikenellaceae bacterium]